MVVVSVDVWTLAESPFAKSPVVAPEPPGLPASEAAYRLSAAPGTAVWSGPEGDRAGVSPALTRRGIRVAFTVQRGGTKVQGTLTLPEGATGFAVGKLADGRTLLVRFRASAGVKA